MHEGRSAFYDLFSKHSAAVTDTYLLIQNVSSKQIVSCTTCISFIWNITAIYFKLLYFSRFFA